MTLENCYKWYKAFKSQGRTEEAEEMKRKIEAKGGSIKAPKEDKKKVK